MEEIRRKYIVDENKNTVAGQIDISDFEKIERILEDLEDYALGQLMKENDPKETMSLNEAKSFYDKLDKEERRFGLIRNF